MVTLGMSIFSPLSPDSTWAVGRPLRFTHRETLVASGALALQSVSQGWGRGHTWNVDLLARQPNPTWAVGRPLRLLGQETLVASGALARQSVSQGWGHGHTWNVDLLASQPGLHLGCRATASVASLPLLTPHASHFAVSSPHQEEPAVLRFPPASPSDGRNRRHVSAAGLPPDHSL